MSDIKPRRVIEDEQGSGECGTTPSLRRIARQAEIRDFGVVRSAGALKSPYEQENFLQFQVCDFQRSL